MNNSKELACESGPRIKPPLWRVVKHYVKEWFLTQWRKHLYRHVMRLAHRYNWHYAPTHNVEHQHEAKYEVHHHWCQWCGLRGETIKIKQTDSIDKL